MSATATPMGAEPVGGLSACGSFSGKVRHIKIASGYAANIFYGAFVKLGNTGTINELDKGVYDGLRVDDDINLLRFQLEQVVAAIADGTGGDPVRGVAGQHLGHVDPLVDALEHGVERLAQWRGELEAAENGFRLGRERLQL